MKNGEFQESVTDIVLEPIKAIPKKVIENIWDKKQLEEMFIDAGRWVINYERDGTEESELRSIAFCEKKYASYCRLYVSSESSRSVSVV